MSIRLFLGVPGAGKTLAMQDFVRAHAGEWPFFVVDRADEWGPHNLKRWRNNPPQCTYVEKGDLEKISRELLENLRPGVYIFAHPWEGTDVARVAANVGNVVFCDDEIDLVATYKNWGENALRDMCHRGRHLPNMLGEPSELHILGAARRPQNLHTDLTALCDEAFIFRVQGEQTLDRLVKEGMLGSADVDAARSQQNLSYFLWRSTGERSTGKIAPVAE